MVIVVWKKTERSRTYQMSCFGFTNSPDRIINERARKPLIPLDSPFIEVGVSDGDGKFLIEKWKEKYKIKRITYNPPQSK